MPAAGPRLRHPWSPPYVCWRATLSTISPPPSAIRLVSGTLSCTDATNSLQIRPRDTKRPSWPSPDSRPACAQLARANPHLDGRRGYLGDFRNLPSSPAVTEPVAVSMLRAQRRPPCASPPSSWVCTRSLPGRRRHSLPRSAVKLFVGSTPAGPAPSRASKSSQLVATRAATETIGFKRFQPIPSAPNRPGCKPRNPPQYLCKSARRFWFLVFLFRVRLPAPPLFPDDSAERVGQRHPGRTPGSAISVPH